MELLDRLGHASSVADDGPREDLDRLGLGDGPLVGARRTIRCRGPTTRDAHVGSRHRRLARDRQGDRAPSRPRRREADRDRLPALGRRGRGDRRRARGTRRRAGARPWQRLVGARARAGRRPRPDRRARAQRGDRRDPARARDGGQALGLDAHGERAGAPLADACRRAVDAVRDRRSSRSRASARRACWRTTRSWGRRRQRSSRSSATSRSSWARGGSGSTRCRAASSRRVRSSTSRTARRCSRWAPETPPAGS